MHTKICTSCKIDLPLSDYYKRGKYKDGRIRYYSRCKPCIRMHERWYYQQNKEQVNKRIKDRRDIGRRYVLEYISDKECVDCGISNPLVLQFDHEDPSTKKNSVCNMVSGGFNLDSIKEEIEKCVIRCANCHQIKTAHEFNHYKSSMLNNPQ